MYLNYFFIIFFVTLLFIQVFKSFAPAMGFIDIPNARSTHTRHTPRGAGIGFVLAIAIILPYFSSHLKFSYYWTILAMLSVFFIGFLDDYSNTTYRTKFLVIIVATTLLFFDGIYIHNLGTFGDTTLTLGWFALPFSIFAVVGFTNALNLIDGIDGLSATISIIILASFFLIGYTYDDFFIMLLSSAFFTALLAFLLYNWHPASIFMGDSGSLTLGFVISILSIKSLNYIPATSILFITAIPIIDTILVMLRRKRNKKSIFSADKCHMHHIFKNFFENNTPKTVFSLGMLQAIYSLTGLQFTKSTNDSYTLILFLLNIILIYLFLNTMIHKQGMKC